MSLKSLLAQLQKDYLASFPEKVMNLRELHKMGNLDELRTEYHKLKGTGRTYGLPEVSQIGEVLETLCDQPDVLPIAVPISLALLEKVRETRTKGNALKVEDDGEFKALVELVVARRRSA
jgi:HPt (histidine-containing phosphotransfer) domain-containing protein